MTKKQINRLFLDLSALQYLAKHEANGPINYPLNPLEIVMLFIPLTVKCKPNGKEVDFVARKRIIPDLGLCDCFTAYNHDKELTPSQIVIRMGNSEFDWIQYEAWDGEITNLYNFSVASYYIACYHLNKLNAWELFETISPTGGILMKVEGDEVVCEIVEGEQRPDLPFYCPDSDGGVKTVFGRNYEDESETDEEETPSEEEPMNINFDEEYDEDSEEEEEESSYLETLPWITMDVEALNVLLHDYQPKDTSEYQYLPIVLQFLNDGYYFYYGPLNDSVCKVAQELDDDLDGYDEVLLGYERTVLEASFTFPKLLVKKKNGDNQLSGNCTRQELANNAEAFFIAIRNLSCYLLDHNLYDQYISIDKWNSVFSLYLEDDEIKYRVMSGKNRPDMVCFELSLFGFGSKTIARPYVDEIAESWFHEDKTLDELIESAEEGDVFAMNQLALNYMNGDDDLEVEPDAEKAFYWYQKAAEAGDSEAMYNLALFYEKGFTVDRDLGLAAEWMEKAAENGDMDALDVVDQFRDAASLYERAQEGDTSAMGELAAYLTNIGDMLEQCGPDQDYEDAYMWANKAYELGDKGACFALGLAYEHGRGVRKNRKRAAKIYFEGANAGDHKCMHNYGCMVLRDEVKGATEEDGFHWALEAAKLGNTLAIGTVVNCYEAAIGVETNLDELLVWLDKGDEADDEDIIYGAKAAFIREKGRIYEDDELIEYYFGTSFDATDEEDEEDD